MRWCETLLALSPTKLPSKMFNMKAVKTPDPGGGMEYNVILLFNSTLIGSIHSGLNLNS